MHLDVTDAPLTRRGLLRGTAAAAAVPALLAAGPPAAAATTAGTGLPLSRTLLEQVVWGAYASSEPYPSCDSHLALEQRLGTRLPWMSWFFNWSVSWPTVGGQQAAAGRYDVLLAWQPQKDGGGRVLFADVLAGRYDDYLTRFFTKAAAHPGRVVIRFAHEMNGSGYPWCVGYRGTGGSSVRDAAEFVATWRYVVDFQRRLGASNISWAWCIMSTDKGGVPAEQLYPGDAWVDVLAMDLYNGYGGWQHPRAVISFTYRRLAALHPTKPIWVAELGCREPSIREAGGAAPVPGASKAEWYRTLFASTEFPRLTNVNFFHAAGAYDWRVDSTPDSLTAVRQAFAHRASMAASLRAW